MKTLIRLLTLTALAVLHGTSLSAGEVAQRHSTTAQKLKALCDADTTLWPLMAEFCDYFPRRLSGSAMLDESLTWLERRLTAEGWTVKSQPVMVPNWKRGQESARLIAPYHRTLPMLGLGGSVGTGGKPLRAEILVVTSFDDLRKRGSQAKGRIVVWNVPFTTYGQTVAYRYNGASEAARYGAVASLVRSVGPFSMQTPHTGGMAYNDSLPKIPAAAITMEDALFFQRMQDRGEQLTVELVMNAVWEQDAPSRNIIVEIPGTELPHEVVVMGGHIDSWDVGFGAMDDAGGCIVAWRALRHIRDLGLKPKRTIRMCFWTNEENGLRGGEGYAQQTQNERHVMGIESDGGVFTPTGFSTSAKGPLRTYLEDAALLLAPIGASTLTDGEGGADTSPLHEKGVPVMELVTDGPYFWYHHTDADSPDKLDPKQMADCTYAMAVMAWVSAQQ